MIFAHYVKRFVFFKSTRKVLLFIDWKKSIDLYHNK